MSTLPLSLRKEGLVERHQLEGADPSERYFNRSIAVNRTGTNYQATVMYEALVVDGRPHKTIADAVADVVTQLRNYGFRRMRTRPNFRGKRYLAEKETWVDYAD
ncbi:MAG: hypothetical protein U0172_08085 [Nitrospiraceae bacterium]